MQFGLYSLPYYLSYSLLLIAPLVVRRVFPVLSFATVAVLCLFQLRLISSPVWGDIAVLVAVSSVARYGVTWARWGGLAVGLLGAVIGPLQWLGGTSNIHQGKDLYPLLAARDRIEHVPRGGDGEDPRWPDLDEDRVA